MLIPHDVDINSRLSQVSHRGEEKPKERAIARKIIYDTTHFAALLAVRGLTLLEPLLVLVALVALPVDRVLHVVVNMTVTGVVIPYLPRSVVAVRLRLTGGGCFARVSGGPSGSRRCGGSGLLHLLLVIVVSVVLTLRLRGGGAYPSIGFGLL